MKANAPDEIFHVSHTQMSVARHYGGCTFNGASYHYDAERDALVRMDVWRARIKEGKAEARRIAAAERKKWQAIQQDMELSACADTTGDTPEA